jgi:hypothetical protein
MHKGSCSGAVHLHHPAIGPEPSSPDTTMSFANATNPFAPNDEDMATLWLDRTNFIGAVLGGVAYGPCSSLS